jgi:Fur family ferric uptake transcriptional regulator
MERATRQRAAIRHTLEAASRPLLPHEVLEGARAQVPGLGIATVYRCLKQLVEERALQVVELPGENPRYERVDVGHHHHFQCRGCDRVFDVHACPGDLGRLAPAGFSVEDHELTLYGRCSDCQPRPPATPAPPRRRSGVQPK